MNDTSSSAVASFFIESPLGCRGRHPGVGDTVDVIKPRGDQGDLQDAAIVETGGAEIVVVGAGALGGVAGELDDVFEHGFVLSADGGGAEVFLQRGDHFVVEAGATQKLCVGFDSIEAAVGDGDHGGDHFVLVALEREIRRHHGAEGAEGVEEDVGEERVGAYDAVFEAAIDGGGGRGVFDGIELALF